MNQEKLERLKNRYGFVKNSKIIKHYGDCGIYNAFCPVCTCGLLMDLEMFTELEKLEVYPDYEKDIIKQLQWEKIVHDRI
jgi:hypothetical protein